MRTAIAGGAERPPASAIWADRPEVAVWLLLAPCLLYLAAFAIYPLIYSLRLSFTDLTAADGTGKWVGLRNYVDLLSDPLFWNAAKNSVIMVAASVSLAGCPRHRAWRCSSISISTGSWIVRGILVLPMLLTPIVVGVMWRALLNPDWGLVNWIIAQFGFDPPNWLGSIEMAMKTLVMVDVWQWTPFVFIIVYARLQALPQDVFEAAQLDGASAFSTFRRVTLPLLMPAISLRGGVPRDRRVPVVRPDLRAELWRTGAQHDHAELSFVPERISVPELRLRRRGRLYDAAHPDRRHHGAAALREAALGARSMKRLIGRAVAYLVLIALGIVGIAPFVYLAILSCKRRIEILAQVPPDSAFRLGDDHRAPTRR